MLSIYLSLIDEHIDKEKLLWFMISVEEHRYNGLLRSANSYHFELNSQLKVEEIVKIDESIKWLQQISIEGCLYYRE